MVLEVETGRAAREGDIDVVKLWLATGGSPTAITVQCGNRAAVASMANVP